MPIPQIACPKCDTRYPFDAALAGKKVKCANCGHMFYQPAKATIEPPAASPDESPAPGISPPPFPTGPPYVETPPSQPSAVPIIVEPPIAVRPIVTPIVDALVDQKTSSRSNTPTGFVDFLKQLFDFRVEKYLTLYIVRMYWILALVVVALYLVGILLSLLLEGPRVAFRAPTSENALLDLLGQPRQSTSEYANVLETYDRFKWFALKVIFGISAILMVRVWCEILVVAFNIANSLKSIEQKIDALDRKD